MSVKRGEARVDIECLMTYSNIIQYLVMVR